MKAIRAHLLWALLAGLVSPQVAALDQARTEAALEREANRVRAAAGLAPLTFSAEAKAAARVQAAHLARINTLTHSNPARGARDVSERLRSAGLQPRFAAEIAALNFELNYEPGRNFHSRDAKGRGPGSIVSYTPNGPALPPHTPASFAAAVVGQWLRSPGHRRNLLAPEATHAACAISFGTPRDPFKEPLGRVFVVQVLAAASPDPAGADRWPALRRR